MTPRELLDACDRWNVQASNTVTLLNSNRAILLKEAKRLKMTAAVKSLLVLPRVGEPVAAEAPAAYPTDQNAVVQSVETPHQTGPPEVPPALRRTK